MIGHKAKVMGRAVRKRYFFGEVYHTGTIREKLEFVKHVEIWSGELEKPLLKVGDNLYIASKNQTVKITGIAKSTEGGYVYLTDHLADFIEDEESLNSKVKATKSMKDYEERVQLIKAAKENKKWYQFWK
ncbi:hypothetical protein [Rossellomorea marisflavi]|uniref:hypothetical protein n=1 Tax=Rossellomorea marisflavi TaxID=189381 RepID=UPI00345D0B88